MNKTGLCPKASQRSSSEMYRAGHSMISQKLNINSNPLFMTKAINPVRASSMTPSNGCWGLKFQPLPIFQLFKKENNDSEIFFLMDIIRLDKKIQWYRWDIGV